MPSDQRFPAQELAISWFKGIAHNASAPDGDARFGLQSHLNMWTAVSLDVTGVTYSRYGWGTINTFIGGGDAIEELQANRAQLLLRAFGAEGMSPKTSQR